jgi:hypothetical protein
MAPMLQAASWFSSEYHYFSQQWFEGFEEHDLEEEGRDTVTTCAVISPSVLVHFRFCIKTQ